jgi:hypothetical protein
MKSIITKALWTIWITISLTLIGTLTTDLEVTNGLIKKGVICIFIFGFVNVLTIKRPWPLIKTLTVSTVVFALFLIFNRYLDWRGDWKTQTIIYTNNHLSNRTIEFQLQDKGSFGYNRRIVDRFKLFPFLSWTKKLTEENLANIDSLAWDKVDIHVNEQGLKGG